MKRSLLCLGLALPAGLVMVPASLANPAAPAKLGVVSAIALSHVPGWDYLNLDPENRQLFIPEDDRVIVIDLDDQQHLHKVRIRVPHLAYAMLHGIAIDPRARTAFVAVEKPGGVYAFDAVTGTRRFFSRVVPGADSIWLDAASHRLAVGNGKAAGQYSVTFVDLQGRLQGIAALPGRPEGIAGDGHGRVFVNIADRDGVAEVDATTMRTRHFWKLPGCSEPGPIAYLRAGVAAISCGNNLTVAFSFDKGQVVSEAKVGDGADALGYDPADDRLYVPDNAGHVNVFSTTGNHLDQVGTIDCGPSGRTLATDPVRHRSYVLTGQFGRYRAIAGVKNPHHYPRAIEGTVKVAVVGSI